MVVVYLAFNRAPLHFLISKQGNVTRRRPHKMGLQLSEKSLLASSPLSRKDTRIGVSHLFNIFIIHVDDVLRCTSIKFTNGTMLEGTASSLGDRIRI